MAKGTLGKEECDIEGGKKAGDVSRNDAAVINRSILDIKNFFVSCDKV